MYMLLPLAAFEVDGQVAEHNSDDLLSLLRLRLRNLTIFSHSSRLVLITSTQSSNFQVHILVALSYSSTWPPPSLPLFLDTGSSHSGHIRQRRWWPTIS